MIKKILLFLFLLTISLYFVNADITDYTIYYGTITINDGSTTSNVASGQTLSATIDSVDSGSATITTTGEYKLLVTCTLTPSSSCNSATITFSLSTPSGYDSVNPKTDFTTYSTANNGKYVSLNLAFSGTPTAAAAPAAAEAPGKGGGAMASKAITPEALTKVDITTIPDIIASLPEGWTNVDVYQVGESVSETVTENLANLIDSALKHATDPKSISVLQTIQNKLKEGKIIQLNIVKTLTIYKITNKDTGQSIYRSEMILTLTAPNNLINAQIVEVIPHAVLDSIEGIYFPGIKPEILQTNPIFQWTFEKIDKGETKSLSYIFKKKIDKITDTITIAVAEEIPEVKKPIITKAVIGIIIIVIIVLVGLAVYYQYLKKKEKGEKKKR